MSAALPGGLEYDPSAGHDGRPMSLAEQTDIRLRVAGIAVDDPGLVMIREQNARAAANWTGPARRSNADRNRWRR